MKILMAIITLLLPVGLLAQNGITGVYHNYFFSEIHLQSDRTFLFNWHHDLTGRWAKGRWTVRNDTVYFHKILMYDTLSITGSDGKRMDTLFPEKYSKQRRLTAEMMSEITVENIDQNGSDFPDTLLFKEDRLYEVKNGKLVTEKQPGIRRGSEHEPWYFKFADD